MGRSIFYPHPPKDDGFSQKGGSDFSFQEAHKILTLQTNFSKVPTKKEPGFRFPSSLGGCRQKMEPLNPWPDSGEQHGKMFKENILFIDQLARTEEFYCSSYW